MSKFWGDIIKKLEPYTPGEQPKDLNLIKLNTNENPFGPGQSVLREIKRNCEDILRLYPDPESNGLRKALAKFHNLPIESVFVSNGSDESLAFIFQGLLKKINQSYFQILHIVFILFIANYMRFNIRKYPLIKILI